MANRKYLTKSLFKKALECPTKLFYTKKPDEYADVTLNDPFLKALANGGFQIGELAKCCYPEGILVGELDYASAIDKTNNLLRQENVTIFEAAVQVDSYFIRVDILKKTGSVIELIEVKSKSVDPSNFDDEIWHKPKLKKGVYATTAAWQSYLYDVAFQTFVTIKAFPEFQVHPYLMCADKTQEASVNGLNQKFLLREENGKTRVEIVGGVSLADLGVSILANMDVGDAVRKILSNQDKSGALGEASFEAAVSAFAKHFIEDIYWEPTISKSCKNCEFRTNELGLKSGFKECFQRSSTLSTEALDQPLSFDIWGSPKADSLIDQRKLLMAEVDQSDIGHRSRNDTKGGMSQSERQWLQVQLVKSGATNSKVLLDDLEAEMGTFVYPLHFIDFETCQAAIPFSAGRRPYEQLAFQFSHHVLHSDGRVEHFGEYLNASPGVFPNFEFVRALKADLEGDSGTIFMFARHENTVLCKILQQLSVSQEPDKDELMHFIESITEKPGVWAGKRKMVDLCDLIKRYYYNPMTGGSNSIKAVFPAILNDSKFLQKRYSKPMYGSEGGITSKNFKNHCWIVLDQNGNCGDPYQQLPPAFSKYDREKLDLLTSEGEINNGGAAMTAYAYLQFVQMSDEERRGVEAALLKYCELDTLAMVMIYEAWLDMIQRSKGGKTRSSA